MADSYALKKRNPQKTKQNGKSENYMKRKMKRSIGNVLANYVVMFGLQTQMNNIIIIQMIWINNFISSKN